MSFTGTVNACASLRRCQTSHGSSPIAWWSVHNCHFLVRFFLPHNIRTTQPQTDRLPHPPHTFMETKRRVTATAVPPQNDITQQHEFENKRRAHIICEVRQVKRIQNIKNVFGQKGDRYQRHQRQQYEQRRNRFLPGSEGEEDGYGRRGWR